MKDREKAQLFEAALNDILYHRRPLGPTKNKMVEWMELRAMQAIAAASGGSTTAKEVAK